MSKYANRCFRFGAYQALTAAATWFLAIKDGYPGYWAVAGFATASSLHIALNGFIHLRTLKAISGRPSKGKQSEEARP